MNPLNFCLIDHVDYDFELDVYTYYLNFLDQVNDGIPVYYQPQLHKLTDDGWLEFEYESQGFHLADYQDELSFLIAPHGTNFEKRAHSNIITLTHQLQNKILTDRILPDINPTIYTQSKADVSANLDFSQYVQSYLACFTYLDLLGCELVNRH